MALTGALVDRARLYRRESLGVRVEGSTQFIEGTTPWIRARLFLEGDSESQEVAGGRTRDVSSPTLLLNRVDTAGGVVSVTGAMRVGVTSNQFEGEATYSVAGDPQPIRKKRRVIAWYLRLERVVDHAVAPAGG